MHNNKMVRAAGAENSSNPVALPRTFSPKSGKKVADATKKMLSTKGTSPFRNLAVYTGSLICTA